jgi:hypothetical protein
MLDPKQHIGPVLFVCLVFYFLLSHAGPTLTHPAKASSSAVHGDLSHIPPAVPLLLPVRAQGGTYDRPACRRACVQIGIWDRERDVADRLVNTCKIGCDLGQQHCS